MPRLCGRYQPLVHDVRVHETQAGLVERLRDRPDDRKAHLAPEMNRALVRRDDEIELHRPIAARDRLRLRVVAHARGDSTAAGVLGYDVAAVADVRSSALEVRPQVVR